MPARKTTTTGRRPAEKIKQMGEYIVADPKICHGKPTFRGTRIMVGNVLDMVAEGMPWDEIVYEWDGKVPREAISEAIRLASDVLLRRAAALQS